MIMFKSIKTVLIHGTAIATIATMSFPAFAQVQNAPAGAENIAINLEELQIDGVNIYTAEDLDPIYKDKLGSKISLADVYVREV